MASHTSRRLRLREIQGAARRAQDLRCFHGHLQERRLRHRLHHQHRMIDPLEGQTRSTSVECTVAPSSQPRWLVQGQCHRTRYPARRTHLHTSLSGASRPPSKSSSLGSWRSRPLRLSVNPAPNGTWLPWWAASAVLSDLGLLLSQ